MSDGHIQYRPEVDGLRAIAVLIVILFHANIPGLSGGFVGVDVFFVISGYLITSIILKQLRAGSFSFGEFYRRRARRILPALLVVLSTSAIAGWFLQDPYLFERLGQSLMAVTAFVSNILYWRTTNYFTAGLENPLLHTWSLAVEEQFYVLFPLALWLAWRFVPRWLLGLLLLCALTSLTVSQISVHKGRALAAFYLLPARAYELLIGAVLAAGSVHAILARSPVLRHGLGWLGIAGIVLAAVIYDANTPFPGLAALLPALATACVLCGAASDNGLGRLLSAKPMVKVGLLSYSAYLWHQPVFTFAHAAGATGSLIWSIGLIAVSLILAWTSWRFVETPFRDASRMHPKTAILIVVIGSLAVFVLGLSIWATQGAAGRFSAEQRKWWAYGNIELQSKYVVERFNALETRFAPDPGRRVLVIGDSQAQDFVNMMAEAGAWRDAQVRTIYIRAACQPVWVNEDIGKYIAAVDRYRCPDEPTMEKSRAMITEADTLVLAANWQLWSASRLAETIDKLDLRADQRLIVVGPKRFAVPDVRKLEAMNPDERARLRYSVEAERLRVNAILAEQTRGRAVFVDLIASLCQSGVCPWMTPDDELISYDGGHLTQDGARYARKRVFGHERGLD